MRPRWWRTLGLLAASAVGLSAVAVAWRAETNPATVVPTVDGDIAGEFAAIVATAPLNAADPVALYEAAIADPALALDLAAAVPDPTAGSLSAALAVLTANASGIDASDVGAFFADLTGDYSSWLAVLYPSTVAHLPGAPFADRVAANGILITAAAEASTVFHGPERPWHGEARPVRSELAALVGTDRQFIYFDAYANRGKGSWVEIVGDLDTASSVAVLVPGGSAMVTSANFELYNRRAQSFVDAAGGDLAVIVWAGAAWPTGWIQEAWASWTQEAAPDLAAFTRDLRSQVGPDVHITLAGHSYGGPVVGVAETYRVEADRVLHIASAGVGHGITTPGDYTEPCRERYSITAPNDPISWVQGVPYVPLLGHGADPDEFPGTRNLYPGHLPDGPDAVNDWGRSLESLGISGKAVEGVHSHSEVFYPDSDAWRSILAVLVGDEPEPAAEQPPAWTAC